MGGGLVTAAVAALVAFVGVLIARGVFDIELLSPKGKGTLGDSPPRPMSYFSWIMGLVTVIFTVVPFTTDAKLESQVATA